MWKKRTQGVGASLEGSASRATVRVILGSWTIFTLVLGALWIQRDWEAARNEVERAAARLQVGIEGELGFLVDRANALASDSWLIEALSRGYDDDIEGMIDLFHVLRLLNAEPDKAQGRQFFTIYTRNATLYEGNYVERMARAEARGIPSLLAGRDFAWSPGTQRRPYLNDQPYLCYYRPISYRDRSIGIVEGSLSLDHVEELLGDIPAALSYRLADAQGETLLQRDAVGGGIARTIPLRNGHSLTIRMPLPALLAGSLRTMGISLMGMMGFIALFSWLSRQAMHNAFLSLRRFMERLERDDLLLRPEPLPDAREGTEIAILQNRFNALVLRIRSLYDQAAQMEVERARLEFELWQASINPHLLYNSLSLITWNARWKQDDKTVALVEQLTRFYRSALRTQEWITVREEIDMVRDFVALTEAAYARTYDLSIEVPEAVLDQAAFRHFLQPVVENALLHGLNGIEREARIAISAEVREGLIEFCVADNGVGMSQERLRVALEPPAGNGGYGLYNLEKRIRLRYGDPCGLFIQSEPGNGTRVRIRIRDREAERLGAFARRPV